MEVSFVSLVGQDAHFRAQSSQLKISFFFLTLSVISISGISLNANLSLSPGIAGRLTIALNNFHPLGAEWWGMEGGCSLDVLLICTRSCLISPLVAFEKRPLLVHLPVRKQQ